MVDVWSWNTVPLPIANQYVYLWDSTRGLVEPLTPGTVLTSTAGSYRGKWARTRFDWFVQSTTQDVTQVRQIWDGTAWQTVSSGSVTLTAGTGYSYGWMPEAPDSRCYILAGGTGPATLLSTGSGTRGDGASGA